MTSLLRSIPVVVLLGLIGLSCTTNNISNVTNPVVGTITPTIARFSPDTAWTFRELAIFGTNFGYDVGYVLVTIDTTRVQVEVADDTVLKVLVPEGTRSGLIRVRTYEQTATSAKPVTVKQTFHPHPFTDSIPEGASFSVRGSGMNNYHGSLHLFLNGTVNPIDSVFPDRIVSHVIHNSYSSDLVVSDADTSFTVGTLYVTMPSSWTTFSQIWNRASFIVDRYLTGYTNGMNNTVDSSWRDTVIYDRQIDTNITAGSLVRGSTDVSYSIPSSLPYRPLLQVTWNTASKYTYVTYYRHTTTWLSPYHMIDTVWTGNQELTTKGAVGADIEFTLSSLGCTITETTTDSTGSINLREITTLNALRSGEVDLILKH